MIKIVIYICRGENINIYLQPLALTTITRDEFRYFIPYVCFNSVNK